MVRVAALMIFVAGCDGLFHINEVMGVADGRVDGSFDGPSNCFIEAFSGTDADLGPHWVLGEDPGCHAHASGGELVLQADSAADCYAWAKSRDRSSFVGEMATVEVPQVIENGEEEMLFEINLDDRNFYMFEYDNNTLDMRVKVADVDTQDFQEPYDSVAHRFWRFQYNATTPSIDCQTSPDGMTWITQHSMTLQIPVTNVEMQLLAGTYSVPPTGTQTAKFDNYSRCTP